MVCMRNIASLLLALAAVPAVMGSPVVGRANKADPLSDLLGSPDSSTVDSDSDSSSVTPAKATTTTSVNVVTTTSSTPDQVTSTPTVITSSPVTSSPSAANSPTTAAPTTTPHTTKPPVAKATTITNTQGQAVTTVVTITPTDDGSNAAPTDGASPSADAGTGSGPTTSQSNNNSGGLDPQTTKIVAGVVGGVGGAILIAAIAAVAYRVWGKNRNRNEEDDNLMGDGVYGTSELKGASGNTGGPSPFTNNLEQYHTPGKANPSANF